MKENTRASDWAADRGAKWRAQLTGMESMLRPIDEPLLRASKLDEPFRIAELGCGGGGTAMEIRRQAPTGSLVHAFDISPSLIAVASERPQPREGAVVFQVADMALARPEEPYGRIVSRFGVMFFDEPEAAFANLWRWLAPGGRFAFAVWGPLSENPWMATTREVVARLVEIPEQTPDAPGPFRYGDAARLFALLDRAGFADLDASEWRGALPIGGELPPAEAAQFALAAFASFGELLSKAGDEALHEARRSLTALFSGESKDGPVRMQAFVRIFTGTRG